MARETTAGIDIGTYQIKVVIAEKVKREDGSFVPKIIGTGFAESKGLRHGYIVNTQDVAKGIRSAISQAEKMSGVKVKQAYLAIGGIGLSSITSTASITVSRGDSEISDLDLSKVIKVAEDAIPSSLSLNRKIIHSIPLQYKIDGKPVLGRPVGLKGTKFEVKALFVTCLERHVSDIEEAVAEAGIKVLDVIASPIAASMVTLTKAQKIAGCVLANIGSETVSIAVFENNLPVSLEIFPIGSTDITNDIALGLRIPLDMAEELKRGAIIANTYPKKKLEEIIEARLSDIFELVEAHLKKIGKSGLLPAGIILTGGGSGVTMIEEFAKSSLKIPSKIGHLAFADNSKGGGRESNWSVAFGLCILGFDNDEEADIFLPLKSSSLWKQIRSGLDQLMP